MANNGISSGGAGRAILKGMGRRAFLAAATAAGILAAQGSGPAFAAYPEKPIRLIVPLAPGGPTDLVARALAQALEPVLKQSVIVENKPGANGQIAYEYVAAQPADGLTLVMSTVSSSSLNITNPGMKLDIVKAFAPISIIEERPIVIISSAKSPFTTFEEMIKYAKQNPGKLNHAAIGAASELAAAWLDQLADIKAETIRYPGAAPAVIALLSGEADYHQSFLANVKQHVDSGALRLLATSGAKRWPRLAEIPAIAEFYPDYHWTSWTGLMAPAGVPTEVIDTLNAAVREALNSPKLQAQLAQWGTDPAPTSPQQFAEKLVSERDNWIRIARTGNITFK